MIPGQGTKIPHAGWPSWKKKRNILKLFSLTYFTFTRQKDTTLKDEALRLVGAQYASGEEWRNSSIRNKEAEPKQKQYPVVDVAGGESKVRYCKEQYCIRT